MGPIIYVLLQVTFLVFGKFFEKEEMQKNIKSHEREKLKMKTVSRVKTGRKAKKHQKLEWENGELGEERGLLAFFIWDKLYNISQWIS